MKEQNLGSSPSIEEQYRIEGFDEQAASQVPNSALKIEHEKLKAPRSQSEGFYKIPEAKPLLSKNFIDFSKPKVLIKEILIYKEPSELTNYKISSSEQSNGKQHQTPNEAPFSQAIEPTTLWDRYLVKGDYECIYLKYIRESLKVYYPKNASDKDRKEQRKKLRAELLKMCHKNENLFNTYFVDLDFITEAGSSLIRNLVEGSMETVYSKFYPQHSDSKTFQRSKNQGQEVGRHHEPQALQSRDIMETDEGQEEVKFDSKFQCGNLFAVFQKIDRKTLKAENSRSFDLVLQNDINTKGYTNWFYFCIKSPKIGTIIINIVNMQKYYSLYSQGMRVVVFSYQKYRKSGTEWQRDGYDYRYYRNDILKSNDSALRLNTLSFKIDQKHENDLLFVAANLPYSYSRLTKFLDGIEKVARLNSSIYLKRETHTCSISSNIAPVLTLTWKHKRDNAPGFKEPKAAKQTANQEKAPFESPNYRKKIVGVIARQHPCETVSSFVMEGFINSLVYLQNENSVELLKKYIFKIVPMVNVDGVIYGNARCDIAGSDVNRRWTRNPNAFLYPILSGTRKLFQGLVSYDKYEIDYFVDLHGHSKKLGAFIFGSKTGDEVESRCFSWLMSKITNKFYFEHCTFGLSSYKKETARGSMYNLTVNRKTMTVETSFFGWDRGALHKSPSNSKQEGQKSQSRTIKHFDVKDLHDIGSSLVVGLNSDEAKDPKKFNWSSIKKEIKSYIANHKKQMSTHEDDLSGSDSEPSEDEMTFEEKTTSFLPSNVATKIGMVAIKVVERKKKKDDCDDNEPSKQQRKKGQSDWGSFGRKDRQRDSLDEEQQRKKGLSKEPSEHEKLNLNSYFSRRLNENTSSSQYKLFRLRETRSVTKISPFHFSQRPKKSLSTNKIRLAIDIKYHNGEGETAQKLSTPALLPEISRNDQNGKKRDFWEKLNKEYQNVLTEKKLLSREAGGRERQFEVKKGIKRPRGTID